MKQYPSDRFDNLAYLAETLGSFWTELYGGVDLVVDLLRGESFQERQLSQLSQELYDSFSRELCPVLHRGLWRFIDLVEGSGESAGLLRYGDEVVYGPQDDTSIVYAYGVAEDSSWQYGAGDGVVEGFLALDSPVLPTVCLTGGVDFYLAPSRSSIVFFSDPFLDSRFTPYLGEDGTRRIRVYLFNAGVDLRFFKLLYGDIVGMNGDQTESYKSLANSVLDGLSSATAMRQLAGALSAITGVPFAKGGETVELVVNDATGKLIITDSSVYRCGPDSTALVSAGDALSQDQPLVDTVLIAECHNGSVPSFLSGLALNRDLLLPTLDGDLVFNNAETPLVYTGQVSSKSRVVFALGGSEDDQTLFFDAMHTNGVAAGDTLANYLDIREAPATEPTQLNLPPTINPLKFLFENVLRSSVVVVNIKVKDMPASRAGLQHLAVLRKLVSPHTLLLVCLEAEAFAEDATMDGPGDDASAGYSEEYAVSSV